MGLCKCPKRKVTTLFCFEHRVNVCEHCLIENHPRCVVQTYLNWLKDSDYSPNCSLCGISLLEGEVVRLMCYCVFHTSCLEKYYKALPDNTAPAGYKCNKCDSPVFPAPNQAGRVIDTLKKILANYNWARVGLGLPLIDEGLTKKKFDLEDDSEGHISLHGSSINTSRSHLDTLDDVENADLISTSNLVGQIKTELDHVTRSEKKSAIAADTDLEDNGRWSSLSTSWNAIESKQTTDTAISSTSSKNNFGLVMESTPDNTGGENRLAVSRKLHHGSPLEDSHVSLHIPSSMTHALSDPDGDDKYKRRSPLSFLTRYFKSRLLRLRGRDARTLPRKGTLFLILFIVGVFSLIILSTRVGSRPSSNDPNFDPMHNPNVHVAHHNDIIPVQN